MNNEDPLDKKLSHLFVEDYERRDNRFGIWCRSIPPYWFTKDQVKKTGHVTCLECMVQWPIGEVRDRWRGLLFGKNK